METGGDIRGVGTRDLSGRETNTLAATLSRSLDFLALTLSMAVN